MAEATCAGCGCVCDDGRTCALGDAWFALGERPPLARVDGREVSLDEAVGRRGGDPARRRARRSSTGSAGRASRRSAGRWRSPRRSGP